MVRPGVRTADDSAWSNGKILAFAPVAREVN